MSCTSLYRLVREVPTVSITMLARVARSNEALLTKMCSFANVMRSKLSRIRIVPAEVGRLTSNDLTMALTGSTVSPPLALRYFWVNCVSLLLMVVPIPASSSQSESSGVRDVGGVLGKTKISGTTFSNDIRAPERRTEES